MHPIDFMESFLAANHQIREVQLSVYRYHAPESLLDERRTYDVPVEQLRTKYQTLTRQLKEQEDIAFHSVITSLGPDSSRKHLPLLDFKTAELKRVEQVSELLISEYRVTRAALVHSGRSYHLYLGVLLLYDEWIRFMGRALLLNPREGPPAIDARWIGHRLIGGYGALRWSAKGSPFLPEVVREW